MNGFAEILQQGSANSWLFIPSAILLGALHGLEPGHSKTMMAAFIVAIRGTVGQAILLGLSATVSHTAIVWAIALGGLLLGQNLDVETSEPWFQLASAIIMILIAAWMAWRTWNDQTRSALKEPQPHDHGDGHDHGHPHDHGGHAGHGHDESRQINTGHGLVTLEIFETGMPPHWRLHTNKGERWASSEVSVEIERPDGTRQTFAFAEQGKFLQSVEAIPEPHDFMARLTLAHGGHGHDYDLSFVEHSHAHDPMHDEVRALDAVSGGAEDAHSLAHANDIRRRFASQNVTTGQIVLFGLTGGLIPCPAAITVLLLCLQLKKIALGATLVLSFSVGLALTMVMAGVLAAVSMRQVQKRWSGIGAIAQKAPYISSAVISVIALYLIITSLRAIMV